LDSNFANPLGAEGNKLKAEHLDEKDVFCLFTHEGYGSSKGCFNKN